MIPINKKQNPPLSVRNFGILRHGLIFSKFSSILKKRFYFFKIFFNFLAIFFASGGQKIQFLPLKSLFLCKKHPKNFRLRRFRGLIFSKFCSIFFSRFYFFKIFSNSESHGYFEGGFCFLLIGTHIWFRYRERWSHKS